MPRDTKFSSTWLEILDDNGDVVGSWCQKSDDDKCYCYCKVCCKKISVANMGFKQILSHANSKKHRDKIKSHANQSSLVVSKTSGSVNVQLSGTIRRQWVPSTLKEKTLKAEAIMLLTAVKCNFSFSSFNELGPMCAVMFDDSEIAKNVKLSDTKSRYVIKFGLAPYFKKQTFSDLKTSSSYFTIYFDETTTKQVKKQLDIYLSFWSEKLEKIVTAYCDSFFLGHADSEKILEIILNFLSENGLPVDKLLQCSMDGPNVNLAFQKKVNSHLSSLNFMPLIDVGTCTLHQIHTSMKKGLEELNYEIEELALELFHWFKMSAARREDYHEVQAEVLVAAATDHLFQRHVESRWLSLGPVCDRIIEQYPALERYFLVSLPKKNIKNSGKYMKITSFLKDKRTLVYLNFVSFLCNSFIPYLTLLQEESPIIHILYNKLSELVRKLMFYFLKPRAIEKKEGLPLINVNCRDAGLWLPLKDLEVGTGTKKLINYQEHKDILHNIRHVYIEVCEYLQKKLPLSNPLLQDLQYIHPKHQKNMKSKEAVSRIVIHMLKVTKTDAVCDNIKSEFQMYMCEDLSDASAAFLHDNDICKFWSQVGKIKDLFGSAKYSCLTKLIKSCLTISHGNAIPERGFSINNCIVTKDRNSLSELGIRSLRICKDFLKGQPVSSISVTKEMINFIEKAHAEYASYLQQLKYEKQNEAKRQKIEKEAEEEKMFKRREREVLDKEFDELLIQRNSYEDDEKAARVLLNDASEKLQIGIKDNDLPAIKVAHLMIESANSSLKNIDKQLTSTRQKIAEIEKKRKL